MKIAIPVSDTGTLAEEFSGAATFAIFDVHDETRAVGYLGRQVIAEPDRAGCGAAAGFLRTHGVDVVMVHQISDGGIGHLRSAGIVAIKDAPVLPPDALMAHLVSGTLQATPPAIPEGTPQASACGTGGCGSCCGGGGHHD